MLNLWSLTLGYVLLGSVLVAISVSSVGVLTFVQKKSLSGDAVAHALLPGLCMGFLVVGRKSFPALFLGAFVTGMSAFVLLGEIPKYSKVKEDTATAFVLSFFFGVGLLLLTHIQHGGNSHQAGLQQFLFGNVASIQVRDIKLFIGVGIVLLGVLALFFRAFKVLIFDRAFASAIGWSVMGLDFLLHALVVVAVVVGIQSIGIVLMTAMLVAPAAAARFWTNSLLNMFWVAALLASFAAIGGTLVSYRVLHLPAGPCIVLMVSFLSFLSFLLAPKKGLLAKWWVRRCYEEKVLCENIVKLFYTLGEEKGEMWVERSLSFLRKHYPLEKHKMLYGLKRLVRRGFLLDRGKGKWLLTKEGMFKGKEILHLHLLWEAYLVRYLGVTEDHVHEDAESIEHLLTPSIRAELEDLLKK